MLASCFGFGNTTAGWNLTIAAQLEPGGEENITEFVMYILILLLLHGA